MRLDPGQIEVMDDAMAEVYRRKTPAERLANVVFVLDAERNTPVPGRTAMDRRADNRFRLSTGDLPTLRDLRAGGIGRVVKVTHG